MRCYDSYQSLISLSGYLNIPKHWTIVDDYIII